MRSKLAISALVVASLFGATAIASAETQPTASGEGNGTGSKMAPHKMKSSHLSHHVRYSRAMMDKSRPGGQPISRKPSGS
jgi:hypothetical protein